MMRRKVMAMAAAAALMLQTLTAPVMAASIDFGNSEDTVEFNGADELPGDGFSEVDALPEDASGEEDELLAGSPAGDISLPDDYTDAGVVSAEITLNGRIAMEDYGDMPIEGAFTVAVDQTAGEQSLTGKLSALGMAINFAEYMDYDTLLLQIPGLSQNLSFRYRETDGLNLGDEETNKIFRMLGKVLELYYAEMMDPEAMAAFATDLQTAGEEIFESMSFEGAPVKECRIGTEMVPCQGVQTVITKDFAIQAAERIMEVTYPHGQTLREYFNMVLDAAGEDSSYQTVSEAIADFFADMPDMTLSVYMRTAGEEGAYTGLAEVSLSAEDHYLGFQMRGEDDFPVGEMALVEDDTDLVCVNIDRVGANGFRCVLTVEGVKTAVATLSSDMSWSLMISGLEEPITGNFEEQDGAAVINAKYQNFEISCRIFAGGEVVKPEGEALELTTASAAELESVFSALDESPVANMY